MLKHLMCRPLIAGIYVQQSMSHYNKTHLNILNHSAGCTTPHVNRIKVTNVIGHIFDMRKGQMATKQQGHPTQLLHNATSARQTPSQTFGLKLAVRNQSKMQSCLDEQMPNHCMYFIAFPIYVTLELITNATITFLNITL